MIVSKAFIAKERKRILKLKQKHESAFYTVFHNWQQKVFEEFILQRRQGATIVYLTADLKIKLNLILAEHYRRVSEDFVPGIDMHQKSISGTPIDGTEEETPQYLDYLIPTVLLAIQNSIKDTIKVQKPIHFNSIVNTTTQVGNQASTIAIQQDARYSAVLGNKLASKTKTVAITETNWVAEASQNIALEKTTPILREADSKQLKDLQKISPNVTLKYIDVDKFFDQPDYSRNPTYERLARPKKRWVSMGDKRVRDSHAREDGTTINVNDTFLLPGGRLRYPADSGLGADISETINCRCWAMYI